LIPINLFNSSNNTYLPVWHSLCTRASFTVLVWCRDALAVHSWAM